MRLVRPERRRDWLRLIASVVIASAVGVVAGAPLFGQEVRTLKGHFAPVSSVTFSPDGRTLASGGDQAIRIWEVDTGKLRRTIVTQMKQEPGFGPQAQLAQEAFPTGLGYMRAALESLNTQGRDSLQAAQPNGKPLTQFDKWAGALPAAGGEDDVPGRLRQVVALYEASGYSGRVQCVAYSPDGKRLAALLRNCCSMNQLALYDADTGGRLAITDPVGGILIAPSHFDGSIGDSGAAGGYGSTGNRCRSAAFTPDGEYVTSGNEQGEFNFYDACGRLSSTLPAKLHYRGNFTRRGCEYEGHFAGVVAFVFRPDARMSADSSFPTDDPAVHLPTSYNEPSSTRKRVFQLAAVDVDGAIRILDGQGRTVRQWDAAKHVRRKSRGAPFPIFCLAVSPDGSTLASGQTDGQIRLWDADTGERRAVLRGHTGEVETVAFSPDGRLLASGASSRPVTAPQQDTQPDPIVRLWDVSSREEIASWEAHPWGVTAVAFSPDAKTLASGGTSGQIKLWDIEKLLSKNRTPR